MEILTIIQAHFIQKDLNRIFGSAYAAPSNSSQNTPPPPHDTTVNLYPLLLYINVSIATEKRLACAI